MPTAGISEIQLIKVMRLELNVTKSVQLRSSRFWGLVCVKFSWKGRSLILVKISYSIQYTPVLNAMRSYSRFYIIVDFLEEEISSHSAGAVSVVLTYRVTDSPCWGSNTGLGCCTVCWCWWRSPGRGSLSLRVFVATATAVQHKTNLSVLCWCGCNSIEIFRNVKMDSV